MQLRGINKKWLRWIWYLFPAICVVLVAISSYLPDMGEDVLRNECFKSISMALLGASFLITRMVSSIQSAPEEFVNGRPRQETLEEMMESGTGHLRIGTVLSVLLGIVLLCLGGKGTIACIKDMSGGLVHITMENTRVEGIDDSEVQGNNYDTYTVSGLANGQEYTFRVEETANLMRKINYQSPKIIVVYYPESKAIVQMQIYFENDEKVVLPQGDRAYDSRSLEKLPEGEGETVEDMSKYESADESNSGAVFSTPTAVPGTYKPTTESYSEVALEDLNLPEIAIGDNYTGVVAELEALPEEERYEAMWDVSDMDAFTAHAKRVAQVQEEYSVTEEQRCDILYRGNLQLILVYDKETYAIEAVYARELE